jgi:RNA 3'-phosphate cyclase
MLEIDGSMGEGGGQVLRTSLALSILTGRPFCINNIRAGRKQTGLKAQHLKSIDAAAAISHARLEGARLGAGSISFEPGDIRPGRYRFDIGTAGSTALVLQTIYLPLSRAESTSHVQITGGTHVPWAPTFDYLNSHWRPRLIAHGFSMQLEMEKAGFYPAGGGRIQATIRPATQITPLVHTQPGRLVQITGLSAVANLDLDIAARQKRQAQSRLKRYTDIIKIRTARLPSEHKGTTLVLKAEYQAEDGHLYPACCYTALGRLGKPAEEVADDAVDAMLAFLESGAVMDEHLADQILLPLSLAGGDSHFTTSRITLHLRTCAQLIQCFLPVKIEIPGELDQPGEILIHPGSEPL